MVDLPGRSDVAVPPRERRDVFISHTTELDEFPSETSFVAAATSAIRRLGDYPVAMADFGARSEAPADYCRRRVAESDVFVGIVGFRYGSQVIDAPGISYTDLEYEEAVARNLPRLVFLLDERALIPLSLVDHDRTRVDTFRRRLRASDTITASFTTGDGLAASVTQALINLPPVRSGVGLAGSGALTESARPWSVPAQSHTIVPRVALLETLVTALTSPGSAPIGVTTALTGAGGFGKTTLAVAASRNPEIDARFPGGLLWVTLSEQIGGPELAERINDLSETLSGQRPTVSDPEQAGLRLSALLDRRPPMLLVVDDVWRASQLRPFLFGASGCRRLITTRNHDVLSAETVHIVVDAMEADEATTLLNIGLARPLPNETALRLVNATGKWPVLLALVNAALRRMIATDTTVDEAAEVALQRLLQEGPTGVDLRQPEQRREAVRATVEASLSLLTALELDRYLDLAIFPEDTDIPVQLLRQWWDRSHGLRAIDVDRLCESLAGLSLVADFRHNTTTAIVRLHDVIRDYLRHRAGRAAVVARNRDLLAFARGLIDEQDGQSPSHAWWTLPSGAEYLWRRLAFHLHEAELVEELEQLVGDLRWIVSKTDTLHDSVGAEADLALVIEPPAPELRRALSRSAHLLSPLEPSIADTLVSRLRDVQTLLPVVDRFDATRVGPQLVARWPLPDVAHHRLRRNIDRHGAWLRACAFSPDGRRVASASDDEAVRIWDSATGDLLATIVGHRAPVRGCAFFSTRDWMVSAGDDGTVRLWDVATRSSIATLRGHAGRVRGCAVAPRDDWVVSAGDDGTLRIWDVATFSTRLVLSGHEGAVRGCAVSPDGEWLVSSGDDATLRIWSSSDGVCRSVLQGHTDWVNACAVSPDAAWIVSVSDDLTIRIWDAATATPLATIEGHTDWIYCCAISADGGWIASGAADGTVHLWRAASRSLAATLWGHTSGVRGCAFAPDRASVATVGDDHTLRLWDVGEDASIGSATGHVGEVNGCAFAPNGAWLASAGSDGTVRLWDVSSGVVSHVFPGHSDWTRACAVSADGSVLVSAGDDATVRVWAVRSGSIMATLRGGPELVLGCAISPDGRWVAACGNDGTVRVWDVASENLRTTLTGHSGWVNACAISPDGSWIASSGNDGTVRVWDAAGGRLRSTLIGHSGWVNACAISPDGSWIASCGNDGTVRVWDVASEYLRTTLIGHSGLVSACAISSDGSWIASCGEDRTLRVWAPAGGGCLATVRVDKQLRACAWSAAGSELCSSGPGGVYLFTVRPQSTRT